MPIQHPIVNAGDYATDTACCAPLTREPMDAGDAEQLAQVFKALADPVRLRLLSLIGGCVNGEICVCDLVTPFDLSQPTISHHLKVLREAGLISAERRGTWVYYSIRPGALERLAPLFSPTRTWSTPSAGKSPHGPPMIGCTSESGPS